MFMMGWQFRKKQVQQTKNYISEIEHELLMKEIHQAKNELICAQRQYDEAFDHDQIDYSIYYLKAIEKKYSILLERIRKIYGNQEEIIN